MAELIWSEDGCEIWWGDCLDVLPLLNVPSDATVHVICDPPYSSHTHGNARGNRGIAGIVTRDLGFKHLSPKVRRFVSRWSVENASGWLGFFSDRESSWLWRISIEAAGGSYRRTIPWVRWSSPQFNAEAPPSASEDVVFAKPKKRGRKWNGGGRTCYATKCLRNVNKIGEHSTEKPEALMVEILNDTTVSGDIVIDPFMGSGTTGVAAKKVGCKFIGIEQNRKHAEMARDRFIAAKAGNSLRGYRMKQETLF